MKSPVLGATAPLMSPGIPGPAFPRSSCTRPAHIALLIVMFCLVVALGFVPVVAASDTGSITPADTIAREAPAELSPPAADNQVADTSLAEDNGSVDAAAEDVTTAPVNPDEARDILLVRGEDCYMRGDYDCAWAAFDEALRVKPYDTDIYWEYSYFLADYGDYNRSLLQLDAAIAIDPTNGDFWYDKGKILNSAGRYSESGAAFDRAKSLDPSTDIPLGQQYPFNMGVPYVVAAALVIGFCLLGIYIYFREFRE